MYKLRNDNITKNINILYTYTHEQINRCTIHMGKQLNKQIDQHINRQINRNIKKHIKNWWMCGFDNHIFEWITNKDAYINEFRYNIHIYIYIYIYMCVYI